ncbi:uncharacterized protein LOC126292062 [Schistocerca gregaria]|uniref:uncharacterized protein LOC126292062 n=1 Tax=Schistocerca gregaria TaxID=7010 RepID=UPI00211F4128|nr:uncharacterized protein LOC126292062 [Schistocerca gregaria]
MCCFITDWRLTTLVISVLSLMGNVSVLAFIVVRNMRMTNAVLLHFLKNNGSAPVVMLALMLVVSNAAILLDVVLFVGAFRRCRDLVQCWLHGHVVVTGAYLVYFWLVLTELFLAGSIQTGYFVLTANILGIAVTVCFWMMVRSYYLDLQQTFLSTESGSCRPLITNSCVAASSQPSDPCDTVKLSPGTLHSPQPCTSNI